MNDWIYDTRPRRDGVTIPTLWVAIALSLLLHIAVMWHWLPRLEIPSLTKPEHDTLVVRLSPPPGPPATAPSRPSRPAPATSTAQPSRALPTRRPQAAPPPPAAPVIALSQPAPPTPAPPPAAPATAAPAGSDLASYIEARRRARGDPAPATPAAPPADAEKLRSNQIAAANLAQQQIVFGYDPSRSGGMFEIKRMNYSDAEFMFFGWNKEVRHRTAQLIEVKKGANSDIRLAVVRRMIAIIREHEQGDFEWSSQRLGRDVTLSARARDNAGLEDFIMQEFFDNPRLSR